MKSTVVFVLILTTITFAGTFELFLTILHLTFYSYHFSAQAMSVIQFNDLNAKNLEK